MLAYYLLSAYFRSFVKRHRFRRPRRSDHARSVFFRTVRRAVYHVTDAVDKTNARRYGVTKSDFYRLVRYEFRLSSHHDLSVCRLRQLVYSPVFDVFILNIGQNHVFHKSGDKGGFTRTHGTDNAYIKVAVGARCYRIVNFKTFFFFHMRHYLRYFLYTLCRKKRKIP